MYSKQDDHWIELKSRQLGGGLSFSNPIAINDHDFAIATSLSKSMSHGAGIWTYNTQHNTWNRIARYDRKVVEAIRYPIATYISDTNTMYIATHNIKFNLFSCNLKTGKQISIHNKLKQSNINLSSINNDINYNSIIPKSIFYEKLNNYNYLHIISTGLTHFIIDLNNYTIKQCGPRFDYNSNYIYNHYIFERWSDYAFLYLHLKKSDMNWNKKLLRLNRESKLNYYFDCNQQKWNQTKNFKLRLPKQLMQFKYVISKHGKYLILLWGRNRNDTHHKWDNKIRICNLHTLKWKNSHITKPNGKIIDPNFWSKYHNGSPQAILMDQSRDIKHMLIEGFIKTFAFQSKKQRNIKKRKRQQLLMDNDLSIPKDVIGVIVKYYTKEFLYIVYNDPEETHLWRVSLNSVLNWSNK